jgi:hypothetical protein
MRQRSVRTTPSGNFLVKAGLVGIIVMVLGVGSVWGNINNCTLAVSTNPAAQPGKKFNEGVQVTLTANWTGDTPPYAATFRKAGGPAIGTVNTNTGNASLLVTGASLGHGDSQFSVSVIETAQINPVPGTAENPTVVSVDVTAPTVAVVLDSPTGIFSNNAPNNVVRFRVTMSGDGKTFGAPPTVTVEPNPGASPAVDGTPSATEYRYTMTLTNAPGGNYTIKAIGVDSTIPESGRKPAVGQANFTVKVDGPAPATIASASPGVNSKNTTVTFSGKASTGMVQVMIYETGNPNPLGQTAPSGENWTIAVPNITEGRHTYYVRGVDNLGNMSAASPEFSIAVDLTPPQIATLIQPRSPTNATKINISGTGAIDPQNAGVNSLPVKVHLFTNSSPTRAPIQTVNANTDGTFTFVDVPLTSNANNSFYVQTVDAAAPDGNSSAYSMNITVRQDSTPVGPATIQLARGASLGSTTLPINPPPYIGVGDFNVQIDFNEDMDRTVNPSIGLKPANGTEVMSNSGNWIASRTYVGTISIPSGQSATWDGPAALRITGAKDEAGNVMADQSLPTAFHIDTAPPTTTQSSMDTIYVSSNTTSITLTGTSQDALSGVGFVEIATQSFTGGPIGTASVPIFNGTSANYSYTLNTAALAAGRYKLWVYAGDQAKPNPNVEARSDYRILIVDRDEPSVDRISFDDEVVDINEGGVIPTVASDVTKLAAVVRDNGGTGINFNVPPFVFRLLHVPSNTTITGNYTNNGSNTITFTFPKLTLNGTYTVTVQPFDNAGNTMPSPRVATFVYDNTPPSDVVFDPPFGVTVENHYPPIAADQVWAFSSSEPNFGMTSSTIEVTYNGLAVGNQLPGASTTALIWDLYGPSPHPSDQSADGRYDVTVTPKDRYGNTGLATRSHFFLDTQGPVVISRYPTASWVGLGVTSMAVTLSDAPSHIVQVANAAQPGDANWRTGRGSGLNLATSSFRLAANGIQIATGTIDPAWTPGSLGTGSLLINGFDQLVPRTPAGAASLTADVVGADAVTRAQPNFRTTSFVVNYDFYRPSFTFTKPLAGRKYCKNTLTVVGTVADQGTSADLQVVEAKARAGSKPYVNLGSNPALPAKTASVTGDIDIANLPDGTTTVYGTCTDRGGNESGLTPDGPAQPTTVDIVIDRTPPRPPTLILPLNDSVHGTRGFRFKWSSVTDGDRYLIQIADDPSFNNILNHISNASYTEKGQVTQMTEAAFTAPKDGTYYWRVAAIELCEDGYNISAFSPTWRVTADTVKPKVLSVQPTPSSGNKITTGMVTFTIRFSEKMDITVPPTVSLTSAGGQLMLIEQMTFKDDTWTGSTVIPKNNSALYDGNAVISITNAKDLAGNQMNTDSTNMVIINTGPAFEIKLFSNPAHEYELVIVTRSTEPLQAPPTCSVSQGGVRVPVPMNFLKERYYAGAYRINPAQPGKAYIDISGTDLHGMVGNGSVQFTVTELTPETRIALTSDDEKSTFTVQPNSVKAATALYILPRQTAEPASAGVALAKVLGNKVAGPVWNGSDKDLVEIRQLEELGPASLRLSRRIWYSTRLEDLPANIPAHKIHVYRQSGSGWVFCGGTVKDGQITAQIGGPGRLALMADTAPPKMARFSPGHLVVLDDPQPTFEGSFTDRGSGLASSAVRLSIDGVPVPGIFLDEQGTFSWKPDRPLAKGPHQITVEVADRAGNSLRQDFTVEAPGPFGISQLQAYPNPATGNAVYFAYNLQQRAEEIRLRIYDSAGHKVAEFDTSDFPALVSGRIRWDLTNDDGRRVANGVYFYKFETTRGGQTFKSRGKLAVMR